MTEDHAKSHAVPSSKGADIVFAVSGHGMGPPSEICIDRAGHRSELGHHVPDPFGRRPRAQLAGRCARS